MSWGWEGHPTVPPGSTTVETITAEHGATLLRLRHLGLPDEGERRQHSARWTVYTGRLETVTRAAG